MQQLEYLTLEDLEKGLDHNAVKDYAYILHDKDENADGTKKAAHWHICLRFKDSVPTESICNWFGITENYINKIRGRFADALAYLTHKNAPDKYQYLDEEVKSNFDFAKEVASRNNRAAEKERREEIVNLITAGIIREYNYTDYISPQEYDRFRKSIDNAFNYRKDKLEGSDRDMKVIYIYGESESGKTTYAKELAIQNDYSYYISSGSNDLLDGYKGQDCLILDELRPNFIDLSDLLKLLDNHTQSTIKSRYKNKMLECKLVIITTSMNIERFFKSLLGYGDEDIKQLKRRCEIYVKMTPLTMTTYVYQPEQGKYMYVSTYDNPMASRYVKKDRTLDEAKEYVDNLLMFPDRSTKETQLKAEGFLPSDEATNLTFETWHQEKLSL